jgi:hypothetical protein
MKTPRFLVVLTLVNLVLLTFLLLSGTQPALATSRSAVLRGSALEIVDARGRVRASIKVHPAETFEPTGKHYPETVVLRLIDANGRPEVKLAASVEGGGLSFVGTSDETRAQLYAEGRQSLLRLTDQAGKKQVLRP